MSPPPVTHRTVRTNGISMHVAEAGSGPPVVLCHGFPELWYSWRHQLPALAAAGFRAIAPDQRGYGRTDAPSDVLSYDIEHLTADLTGLLDAIGEQRAAFVGHDWGAIVAWQLAVLAPRRVAAVVGMSVPALPRPPARPTDLLSARAGDRFLYILYFQERGAADAELDADPRRSLRMILTSFGGERDDTSVGALPAEGTGFLDTMSDVDHLPPWLSEEDLEAYAGAFAKRGFTGPLNWYRNLDRNWEITEHLSGARVAQPAIFVTGERDPVRKMVPADVMGGFVEDLKDTVVLEGCGHWTQQERPREVNDVLVQFLKSIRDEGRFD